MYELNRDRSGKRWFLQICPWWFLGSIAVREVNDAWRWWDKGQLMVRYPNPPLVLLDAIVQFDDGLNAGQVAKMEKQRIEQETKNK